jgi:hybrid cluster-associated redox disulfide protein
MITGSNIVDDVVTRFPATARVFISRRMHCVGCEVSRFETLAGAAHIYHQALDPLLADLRDAAGHAR